MVLGPINNSLSYNKTEITDNGWHLNFNGATNQSKTDSAIANGHEVEWCKKLSNSLNANNC